MGKKMNYTALSLGEPDFLGGKAVEASFYKMKKLFYSEINMLVSVHINTSRNRISSLFC